ncbi:hypothetical protein DCS_02184 [Drechmeria coniospora]|uniref:Serine/threonine-protein phosphatase 2A activator n=1 Tax=Drechmeria coniospora TaxID=98403 RepID=A0A151GVB6_DRECN|nr:hypothetical protein DCS_02184 [Drechmeria coniospora]KYK61044.1 hypothetical protein DCS_02184 [Drechmeria coniospora]
MTSAIATATSSASASPSDSVVLPTLKVIDQNTPLTFTKPSKRINEGHDVARFLTSLAYRDIGIFVLQLNRALCPRQQPGASSAPARVFPLTPGSPSSSSPILALQALLSEISELVELAPPDPGPRRFGNVSFRTWHALVEDRIDGLLSGGLLGKTLDLAAGAAREEVGSYLIDAFGSAQRLDYGTGHELSFLAFLGCLWKLAFFQGENDDEDMAREIVLNVIQPYLEVVRKLILTYTLEPAGSHGVWGLDDHSFIPYIFGSAQLTRPIGSSGTEPMPLEGSVAGAPKPSDVTKGDVVEVQRATNMYFSAIGFINDVKKGPFWEHSPILFDISGIRDGWGKINKGMIKMFNAEVLSKFPVVQHFRFGELFSWEEDPDAAKPTQSVHMANQPAQVQAATAKRPMHPLSGTSAPWAQATKMPPPPGPGIPYSRAPPGPAAGSVTSRPRPLRDETSGTGLTAAQTSVTRAPWAKDT